jgi:hypothetical protein
MIKVLDSTDLGSRVSGDFESPDIRQVQGAAIAVANTVEKVTVARAAADRLLGEL